MLGAHTCILGNSRAVLHLTTKVLRWFSILGRHTHGLVGLCISSILSFSLMLHVSQAGSELPVELRLSPASRSPVLGLEACAITPVDAVLRINEYEASTLPVEPYPQP